MTLLTPGGYPATSPTQRLTALAVALERTIPQASLLVPGEPDTAAFTKHVDAMGCQAGELAAALEHQEPAAGIVGSALPQRLRSLSHRLKLLRQPLELAACLSHSEKREEAPGRREHHEELLAAATKPLASLERSYEGLQGVLRARQAAPARFLGDEDSLHTLTSVLMEIAREGGAALSPASFQFRVRQHVPVEECSFWISQTPDALVARALTLAARLGEIGVRVAPCPEGLWVSCEPLPKARDNMRTEDAARLDRHERQRRAGTS
jgi:hypothetical protein